MANRGQKVKALKILFSWAPKLLLRRKAMTNLDSILKSKDITLLTKVYIVKAMAFLVIMYRCESWTTNKANCWRIDAFELWCLEKTPESSLDCMEIKPINPKGSQSLIFIGSSIEETEAPILRPPDAKNWLRKDPDAGKDWRQEEKGTTEDEMVGWHHWFNGREFEQTQKIAEDREAWYLQPIESQSWTQLSN